MEQFVNILLYAAAGIILLILIVAGIYGLILLISQFIDNYKDEMFWFSPKEKDD